MEPIKTKDGHVVTEEMIDRWCEALDRGEWPTGEYSAGEVIVGRPPLSAEGSAVLSVKVSKGMKNAIKRQAESCGKSMSDFVRDALSEKLLAEIA